MDVLLDFRDGELRLRTVHDREHGVTAFEQRTIKPGVDPVVAREKSAADHEQNAAAVRLIRLKHIQRQRRAEFAAVNHVFDSLDTRRHLRARGGSSDEKKEQPEGKKFSHGFDHGC